MDPQARVAEKAVPRWLASRRTHPWLWDVADLTFAAVCAVALLAVFGRVAVEVWLALWAVLMVLGWLARFARWKTQHTPKRD